MERRWRKNFIFCCLDAGGVPNKKHGG